MMLDKDNTAFQRNDCVFNLDETEYDLRSNPTKHSLIAFHNLEWCCRNYFLYESLRECDMVSKNAHLWNGDSSCQKLRGNKDDD